MAGSDLDQLPLLQSLACQNRFELFDIIQEALLELDSEFPIIIIIYVVPIT